MIGYEAFLNWEEADRRTVKVKCMYIDIADGDIVAGLLLSQIIYWHLPSKAGKSKLRVKKGDQYWLAKGRNDWWEECRITPRQFDRAVDILVTKGIVKKQKFRFNGSPMVHIYLYTDRLMELVNGVLEKKELSDTYETVNSILPDGEMELTNTVKTITETTTEITTENIDAENQASSLLMQSQNQKGENIKTTIKGDDIGIPPSSEDSGDIVIDTPIRDVHLGHLAKESKRKVRFEEKFKNKSVPDIIAWDKERVSKEKHIKGGAKAKKSSPSSSVIIARFQELYKEFFTETAPLIEIKHKVHVKKLLDHYGFEYTKAMLEEMFLCWAEFKRDCRIKTTANISLLYSFRDYFHERVRNKVEDDRPADEF